jgi:hypothetical protein
MSTYNPYKSGPDFAQGVGDFASQQKMNQIMKQMGIDVPPGLMMQIINLVLGKNKGQSAGGQQPIQPPQFSAAQPQAPSAGAPQFSLGGQQGGGQNPMLLALLQKYLGR